MDASMLDRAIKTTSAIVAGTKAEQLDDPTPCKEWSVRDVLNHLISEALTFAAGAKGEARDMNDGIDHCADDHVASFDAAAKSVLEAFSEPDAMEREFEMPWGKSPGRSAFYLVLADTVVHGWDVAMATGQGADFDNDIAESIYAGATKMLEPQGSFPRGESFDEPVDVPGDSPVMDKVVAYFGRDPNWVP